MEFNFDKNIYLYKGKHDIYIFGNEVGFNEVIEREAAIIKREDKPYGKNFNFIKKEVRHDILNDFECGWSDCTKIIKRDISVDFLRLR